MAGIGDFPFALLGSPRIPPRTASGGLPIAGRRYYVTVGGERLDQVAYQAYGIQSGAVEALLIVNHRLADQPYELPAHLAIELPTLLPAAAKKTSREVQLWG